MFLLYSQYLEFEFKASFLDSLQASCDLVASTRAEAERLATFHRDWSVVTSEDDAAVFTLVDKKGSVRVRVGYIEVPGAAGRHFLVAHTRPVPTIVGSFYNGDVDDDDAAEILAIALRKLEVLPPVYNLSVEYVNAQQ